MNRRDFVARAAGLMGVMGIRGGAGAAAAFSPMELKADSRSSDAACSFRPLPGWVPDTVDEARLVPTANRLQDVYVLKGTQNPSRHGSQVFCDYSGGVYNPWFGEFGAHVVHGGGHSATNDNSVFIVDYNEERPTFRRAAGPTQLETSALFESNIRRGGFPDDPILNPREVEPEVPGSAHTYDNLLVLPPDISGDPLGALIRPVASAIGAIVSRDTGWTHVLPFSSPKWQRWSANSCRFAIPGGSCAFDSHRNRIWPITDQNVGHLSYLDLATRTWANPRGFPASITGYPDMVYSCYAPHADVVIIATNRSTDTAMRFYWFRASSDGSARTPVQFATGDLPTANWGRGSLLYIPELASLVYYTQLDGDAYYQIQVPDDPVRPWSWVRRAISGQLPSRLPLAPADSTYKRLDYSSRLKSLLWVTGAAKSASWHFGGQILAVRISP